MPVDRAATAAISLFPGISRHSGEDVNYQIRELSIGEVLDQTVILIKDHFGLFFGIVASTVVPAYIVLGLLQLEFIASMALTTQGTPTPPPLGLFFAFIGFVWVVLLVVMPLANAAMIYAVGSTYLSRPTTVGECLKHGLRRWGPLLWTTILTVLVCIGGLFLLVVGLFIFAFRFALAQHVTVLENISGGPALKRSRTLMRGNWIKVLVLGLLVFIINYAIAMGAQLVPQKYVAVVAGAVAQGVITILGACAMVVFYFSARCKHENFDLELLAGAVDEP
jgi:hypothetical protein